VKRLAVAVGETRKLLVQAPTLGLFHPETLAPSHDQQQRGQQPNAQEVQAASAAQVTAGRARSPATASKAFSRLVIGSLLGPVNVGPR
jgi:hypothetical protein